MVIKLTVLHINGLNTSLQEYFDIVVWTVDISIFPFWVGVPRIIVEASYRVVYNEEIICVSS